MTKTGSAPPEDSTFSQALSKTDGRLQGSGQFPHPASWTGWNICASVQSHQGDHSQGTIQRAASPYLKRRDDLPKTANHHLNDPNSPTSRKLATTWTSPRVRPIPVSSVLDWVETPAPETDPTGPESVLDSEGGPPVPESAGRPAQKANRPCDAPNAHPQQWGYRQTNRKHRPTHHRNLEHSVTGTEGGESLRPRLN